LVLPSYDPPNEDTVVHAGGEAATSLSLPKQLILYAGTLVGVIFSSAILQLSHGKTTTPNISFWGVLLSVVIALAIIPTVYEKSVKPDAAFLPQLGLFVQHGVFWSVLLEAVSKAL
jgi:uncharacterized membrane protein (UPF0182 family)